MRNPTAERRVPKQHNQKPTRHYACVIRTDKHASTSLAHTTLHLDFSRIQSSELRRMASELSGIPPESAADWSKVAKKLAAAIRSNFDRSICPEIYPSTDSSVIELTIRTESLLPAKEMLKVQIEKLKISVNVIT